MTDDEPQEQERPKRRVPVRRAGPHPFDAVEWVDCDEDAELQWDARQWFGTPPGV